MRADFKYPQLVYNHYKHGNCVDDKKSKRHLPISGETTWSTKRWECRFFAFLLAVTEVNCMLAYSYFNSKKSIPMLVFRQELTRELLNNPYIQKKNKGKKKRDPFAPNENFILAIPLKKFKNNNLVTAKLNYPKVLCSHCQNFECCSYCQCSPGKILCVECYANHRVEAALFHLE